MSLLFVANWKMQLSFDQAIDWFKKNSHDLMHGLDNHQIVFCPTYLELSQAREIFNAVKNKNYEIKLGAQNCSSFERGAYTGEVSAHSLKQVGCSYCIIGHSERRIYFHETSNKIAQKAKQLFSANITPILCIGETLAEHENSIGKEIVEQQLFQVLEEAGPTEKELCIAYEPIYAIGSGKIANLDDIICMFDIILKYTQKQCPAIKVRILYGGSITAQNSKDLLRIPNFGGYLIGGASLDFQELKKIVS